MTKKAEPLKIMVSSTVYGIEDALDRVYDILTGFGYTVWMSHKGSIPNFSNRTAFEDCLEAVSNCDLFLGIIGTSYGSGVDKDDPTALSISHQELQLAMRLNKLRWMLAHANVITARTLLDKLGYEGRDARSKLKLKRSDVLGDLRLIDMYEEATIDNLVPKTPVAKRKGNWVQKFQNAGEAGAYAVFQFHRYQEIEAYVRENFRHGTPLPKPAPDA